MPAGPGRCVASQGEARARRQAAARRTSRNVSAWVNVRVLFYRARMGNLSRSVPRATASTIDCSDGRLTAAASCGAIIIAPRRRAARTPDAGLALCRFSRLGAAAGPGAEAPQSALAQDLSPRPGPMSAGRAARTSSTSGRTQSAGLQNRLRQSPTGGAVMHDRTGCRQAEASGRPTDPAQRFLHKDSCTKIFSADLDHPFTSFQARDRPRCIADRHRARLLACVHAPFLRLSRASVSGVRAKGRLAPLLLHCATLR
jgi:hypothetical protein